MPVITGSSEPKWWRASWVKWTAVVVFLIGGFYGVSDLLGAMVWQQAQKEIAAAGESLDPKKFIPPEVPEEQNFGALPVFEMQMNATGFSEPLRLKHALENVSDVSYSMKDSGSNAKALPYLGRWQKNEQPDLVAVKSRLAELCHEPASTPLTALQLFSHLCPTLNELRVANKQYPLCRFNWDYSSMPSWNRRLGGITSQIKLAKALAYEERLAFLQKKTDLAYDDLQIAWKLESGIRKCPTLIAGLVEIGVVSIHLDSIREALGTHAWKDMQLAELDGDLGKIDCLADYQTTIRGESTQLGPDIDYLNRHRILWLGIIKATGLTGPTTLVKEVALWFTLYLAPGGWADQYKAESARFQLFGNVRMVDPNAHRVFAEKESTTLRMIEDLRGTRYWRDFVRESNINVFTSVSRFAYAQSQIDEARIACRLERYHLTRGNYPASLADLESAYGTNPHDVMNGQPYLYQLQMDGNYLLYSVGWNQKDDGGDGIAPQHLSSQDAPDWVWTNVPARE